MIFVINQLQIHEMDVNLKPFKRVLVKQRFRLPEIGKVHLNLKSCLNVKPMSSELKKRFYRFMLKVYQRVIFLKH